MPPSAVLTTSRISATSAGGFVHAFRIVRRHGHRLSHPWTLKWAYLKKPPLPPHARLHPIASPPPVPGPSSSSSTLKPPGFHQTGTRSSGSPPTAPSMSRLLLTSALIPPVPRHITVLTGIRNADVAGAPVARGRRGGEEGRHGADSGGAQRHIPLRPCVSSPPAPATRCPCPVRFIYSLSLA